MPNQLESIVNKFIPNQYRKQFSDAVNQGNRAAQRLINTITTTPIGTVVKEFKGYYDALNKEIPANSIVSTNPYDMFTASLQQNLSNLARTDEIGQQARQDLIMNIIALVPGLETKTAQGIITNATKFSNPKQVANYITNKVIEARQGLVQASTRGKSLIQQGKDLLQGNIDSALSKATGKNWSMATPEEIEGLLGKQYSTASPAEVNELLGFKYGTASAKEVDDLLGKGTNNLLKGMTSKESSSFINLVKNNAAEIKKLAVATGVTSAKDIPSLLKFAKQVGKIIKNSPAYIKAMATNKPLGTILTSGIVIYDLFQTFRENGDNLIPKSIGTAAAIGSSMFPGGIIAKLFYSALGYTAGTNLSRAALNKLGIKTGSSDKKIQEEIAQGTRREGLSDSLPEYIQGQSGRRYHVLNDRIYDFATGKPVNIDSAIADVNNYVNFQRQQIQDKLKQNQQEQQQFVNYQQQGYNISPDMMEPVFQEEDMLLAQLNELDKQSAALNQPQYNPLQDLLEQYIKYEVAPQEQAQAQIQEQQQLDFDNTYNTVYSKIAQDTFADLDNYINMDALQSAYFQNQKAAMMGEAANLTPDEFVRQTKLQYMMQLAPQIRQSAMNYISNVAAQQRANREMALKERIQSETEKQTKFTNMMDIVSAMETERSNKANEDIKRYTAKSGRLSSLADVSNADSRKKEVGISQQRANIAEKEAETNAKEADIAAQRAENESQLLPYKQAQAAAETVWYAGESELPLDTFLNSNQSVMKNVYPGAFNSQQDQVQNINTYYNTRNNQFQQGR